jgi:peptide/nickel transport system permease protein
VLGGALLVWWAPFARLTRSLVRSALAEPSAVAARALGASRVHLLRTEVRPRLVGPLAVLTAVEAGQLIATVAGLSFLGMGAQPPSAEWGAMLAEARGAALSSPHLVLGPGLAVLVTVFALTCIGEGLRDVLDRSTQVVAP